MGHSVAVDFWAPAIQLCFLSSYVTIFLIHILYTQVRGKREVTEAYTQLQRAEASFSSLEKVLTLSRRPFCGKYKTDGLTDGIN